MRVTSSAVAVLCLVGCNSPTGAPTLIDTEAYLDREVMVGISANDDGVRLMQLEREFGLKTLGEVEELGIAKLQIEGTESVRDTVANLLGDHRVRFAEPNFLTKSMGRPADPYSSYQWNLEQVNSEDALDMVDPSGVIVAVLDTGVQANGPDGIGDLLGGYDFYSRDSNPSDPVGHGTFVAGTIAQTTGNGVGLAAMAPGTSILPVKVMSDQGYGDTYALVDGIRWAADQGADVINMSLGSHSYSRAIEEACNYAYARDVVLVAASGNEFASSVAYPAALNSVIAVGATRVDGTRAGYSNTGSGLELMAPGGDLSKDQNNDGYADGVLQETYENRQWTYTFWEGTSMASPHVAAAAAFVKAAGVNDPAEIRNILAQTATDMGSRGYDTTYGYGIINTALAVDLALNGGNSSTPSTPVVEEEEVVVDTGSDTIAPTISNVSGFTNGDQFTIEWVTDEEADSYIAFDRYGSYGDDVLTTAHSLTFTAGRGMTIVFTVVSTDAAGNTSENGKWQITL